MLSELRDSAAQHELIAENVQERILNRLAQSLRQLKEERRQCVADKDKLFAEHQHSDEALDKCKSKYERAFREVERAEDALARVENDDSASKNDVKKQRAVCDAKKRTCDTLEAEYARQLCDANRLKNAYYYEQLPLVFDQLQTIETRRVALFQCAVSESARVEMEVLPRVRQCLVEIEEAAQAIRPEQDAEVCVGLFKTGYQIPADHVFVCLSSGDRQQQHFGKGEASMTLNGSLSSNVSGGSGSAAGHYGVAAATQSGKSRQNKYRTLNRLKGLFLVTASATRNENDLYDLPPQQLKNELTKKITALQAELDKQHKER